MTSFYAGKKASASAPGKVILFGEHAVVHGAPAVAASLSDLRIHAEVEITENNSGMLQVILPDLSPSIIQIAYCNDDNVSFHRPPTAEDVSTLQQIIEGHNLNEQVREAMLSLLYLVQQIIISPILSSNEKFSSNNNTDDISNNNSSVGILVKVISQGLPSGAGLGSSAAFSVACAAALYKLSLLLLSSDCNLDQKNPEEGQLEEINQWAYASEVLLHGTPSGIDNAVSTYGGVIYYSKGDQKVVMEKLSMPTDKQMEIILTHTHVPRSTKVLVAGVKRLKDQFPSILHGIIQSIGEISRTFRKMIVVNSEKETNTREWNPEEISKLIQMNQNLLGALGVSHPSLEQICQMTKDHYSECKCTTKLTGAGGGGCSFTYLEPDDDTMEERKQRVRHVIESFSNNNDSTPWKFTCFSSSVGGPGVIWT